jgi:hypothetical protein
VGETSPDGPAKEARQGLRSVQTFGIPKAVHVESMARNNFAGDSTVVKPAFGVGWSIWIEKSSSVKMVRSATRSNEPTAKQCHSLRPTCGQRCIHFQILHQTVMNDAKYSTKICHGPCEWNWTEDALGQTSAVE